MERQPCEGQSDVLHTTPEALHAYRRNRPKIHRRLASGALSWAPRYYTTARLTLELPFNVEGHYYPPPAQKVPQLTMQTPASAHLSEQPQETTQAATKHPG